MFKQKPKFTQNRVFIFFASVRLAIPALFAFAVAMIYGTVAESLYGAGYANRVVYHSLWFYLIQGAIVISLILSVLDRIPFKKSLIGFYTVHAAMVVLMAGAVMTKYFGLDGSIEIMRGKPSASVRLPEDVILLTSGTEESTFKLPVVAGPVELDESIPFVDGARVRVRKFIPFAKDEMRFRRSPGAWLSEWGLTNGKVVEAVKLSLPANVQVNSRASVGPLGVEVVPTLVMSELKNVLGAGGPSKKFEYLLFDDGDKKAYRVPSLISPYALKIAAKENVNKRALLEKLEHKKIGLTLFRLSIDGVDFKFVPRFASEPLHGHLELDTASRYRFYDIGRIRGEATVLLAKSADGKIEVGYGKADKWEFTAYAKGPVELPWMGLNLELVEDYGDSIPEPTFVSGSPNKDDEKNIKAALVTVEQGGKSEDLWLTDRKSTSSALSKVEGAIRPEQLYLPFQIELERFKMDMIPGTDKPASYESFVRIHDKRHPTESAHIFMNNPLKKDGYTLYQSSYFQDESGDYHSILSVNRDPGRPLKYAGSLLLVIGLILTFLILHGHIQFEKGE